VENVTHGFIRLKDNNEIGIKETTYHGSRRICLDLFGIFSDNTFIKNSSQTCAKMERKKSRCA
jgi:hypothetical protein